MISLLGAAFFFLGIHLFVSGTRLRDMLVERLGEIRYRAVFSIASAIGLTWLAIVYGNAPHIALWPTVPAARIAALVLVLIGFLFVFIGLTTPTPTSVGQENAVDRPVDGILTITRHPFLWGVAIWALAHLLAVGTAAGLVLFGTMLVLALIGPRAIDAKRARALGARWDLFASHTSNLPFAAVLAGRTRLRLASVRWWQWFGAFAGYALLLQWHAQLFGVTPWAGL
ncbi:NnrU family protein [Roseiterribacter gracilis]|uniref:NnrU protein n=1 Tax=Roseiterribacter gracilis TaxID=2812848 RepID=A0A8S8X839_9PROT|nr:NnrU protein [Rhodospirillales bacterium TMPK1]